MAALMDGKALAAEVREQLGAEVQRLPVPPGLHVILVGPKSDAKAYMQPLKKLCRQVGVEAASTELHDNCSENELRTAIMQANQDPTVHGVLLQLPLPKHMDERAVTQLIAPEKDVDCVHPLSMGKLLLRGYEPAAWPSVAAGFFRSCPFRPPCARGALAILLAAPPLAPLRRENFAQGNCS